MLRPLFSCQIVAVLLCFSASSSCLEAQATTQTRHLLVRPRHREGRRTHTSRDANGTLHRQASNSAHDAAGSGEHHSQHIQHSNPSGQGSQSEYQSDKVVPDGNPIEIAVQGTSDQQPSSLQHSLSTQNPNSEATVAALTSHSTVQQGENPGAAASQLHMGQDDSSLVTHTADSSSQQSGNPGQQPQSQSLNQQITGEARYSDLQNTSLASERGESWKQAQKSANEIAGGNQQASSQQTAQQKSYAVTTTKTYTDWDGQPSWEWDNPRTLYFEPVAGLGNRLRALASAVVVAREAGVGLKVIWREEVECGTDCGNIPPFNSTWPDLFSAPKLRLAPNFPGSNYSVHLENIWLRPNMSLENPDMPPVIPGHNCSVHIAQNHTHLKELLATQWTEVHGEQVLCVKSDLWLTKHGEKDGKFFFRLLQPSPHVKQMLDEFKLSVGWDDRHFIGVHIRRTDLHLTAPNGTKLRVDSLVSLSRYVDTLRKLTALAPSTEGISYFIATDDAEAEAIMRSSFEDGKVFTFPKTAWSRSTVAGIQQALVDVLLLAECPVLVGTYYSSYSETAKLIGWPYYIQIGHELRDLSLESKFDGLQSQ